AASASAPSTTTATSSAAAACTSAPAASDALPRAERRRTDAVGREAHDQATALLRRSRDARVLAPPKGPGRLRAAARGRSPAQGREGQSRRQQGVAPLAVSADLEHRRENVKVAARG